MTTVSTELDELFADATPAAKVKKEKKPKKPTGCEACPLNLVPGINKIFGEVTGKQIMVWTQSPGIDENKHNPPMELVGRSGQWLWREFARVGIRREDCDIQNVVRCVPADRLGSGLYMRDPKKEELKACNVHNKAALPLIKAKIWLVFGRVAAEQLFKKTHANTRIFFHGDAQVFIFDHPAYFLRGGAEDRLARFRKQLDLAKIALDNERFHYIEALDTEIITTGQRARQAAKELIILSNKYGRVAYDEEDDEKPGGEPGERDLLCVGACVVPGQTKVFMLDHPENDASPTDKAIVRDVVKKLLQHKHPKVLQHGCHDDGTFEKTLGVRLNGFDWDTQYGSYMAQPSEFSHSLTNQCNRKYPQWTDYKEYVSGAAPEGMSVEDARDIGQFHLAKERMEKVARYNGFDCHVTKTIERDTAPNVPAALVRVYKDASYVLNRMEAYGPLFDRKQAGALMEVYPAQKAHYEAMIRKLAGNPELNLNSPQQMRKVLYETWAFRPISPNNFSTEKEVLAILRTRYKHPGLTAIDDYRQAKNKIERIQAFERSANAYYERVTTMWWLTGTRTGRLSSGGGTRPDKRNLGNLQNIIREDAVMNMLVSDTNWRDFYKRAAIRMKKTTEPDGKGGTKTVWTANDDSVLDALRLYGGMDWFVAMDYSQMELRVLAFIAGEKMMLDMFDAGKDIHAAVGSLWSGWSYRELCDGHTEFDEMKRTIVKRLHFGIIYGLTAAGLKDDLLSYGIKVSVQTAQGYYDQYFRRFKRVAAYIEFSQNFARRHRYVKNIFGFKVPIDVTDERDPTGKKSFWKNQAVNAPIQGSAHQIMLCAFALMQRDREKYAILRPQMEIHDALIGVSTFDDMAEVIKVQTELMEKDVVEMIRTDFGINWTVPLVAEPKIGFRFGGMVKYKGDLVKATKQAVEKVPVSDAAIAKLRAQYVTV